jgi:hypothetical protein
MIFVKHWHKDTKWTRTHYTGVFLFGFIPIYIRKSDFISRVD